MPYALSLLRVLAIPASILSAWLIWDVGVRPHRTSVAGVDVGLPDWEGGGTAASDSYRPRASSASPSLEEEGQMAAACREQAAWATSQLGPTCAVIVHPPFVLGGDLSAAVLDRYYLETVQPGADAMHATYIASRPHRPITILLFSDQSSYRNNVSRLFSDRQPPHFGSYRPHLRVLALDVSTGVGTILHELTHALIHDDFPGIPDWLNEGLASLHEECRIAGGPHANAAAASNAPRLKGLVNWRLPVLQAAIRGERLRSLSSLMASDDFHDGQERLNYAQARYFCLYLQRQGLLERYYRRLRADIGQDPAGLATLTNLSPGRSVGPLDADFQRWAMQLKPISRGSSRPVATDEGGNSAE